MTRCQATIALRCGHTGVTGCQATIEGNCKDRFIASDQCVHNIAIRRRTGHVAQKLDDLIRINSYVPKPRSSAASQKMCPHNHFYSAVVFLAIACDATEPTSQFTCVHTVGISLNKISNSVASIQCPHTHSCCCCCFSPNTSSRT